MKVIRYPEHTVKQIKLYSKLKVTKYHVDQIFGQRRVTSEKLRNANSRNKEHINFIVVRPR